MFKVRFIGFGEEKEVEGIGGDILLRIAESNAVKLPKDCENGTCGSCAVRIIEHGEEPITYMMEDKEIETLISLGALSRKKVEELQQKTVSHDVRLACQYLVKGDITVKRFNG